MLVQSLHRHVVTVYSKKFALHCFKQYSTVKKKRYCTFWRSFESHISIEQLYSLKGILQKLLLLLLHNKTNISFKGRLHPQWNLQKALATLSYRNAAHFRIYTFKYKKHMVQWMCHFIDKDFARFEGPFDGKISFLSKPCWAIKHEIQSCKTLYYVFLEECYDSWLDSVHI